MVNTTDLMKVDNFNVETAIKQWEDYQKLCEGILTSDDYQKIYVKEKNPETGEYEVVEREFKKKSAWTKLGRAFNVDTRIVDHTFTRSKNTGKILEAYYCVEAVLPNGRRVESDALCSRSEKGKNKQNISDHAIIATAKTRATNRAIGELIGAGESSSDEMLADYEESIDADEMEAIPQETVSETEPETEEEIKNETEKEINQSEVPVLIKKCIAALKGQRRNVNNNIVALCINDKCKNPDELNLCLAWLNKNNVDDVVL